MGAVEGFISLPATNANSPIMIPEMSPTMGPMIPIISLGELGSGTEFIIAASRAWPAKYCRAKGCAAVIHREFAKLRSNP